MLRRLTVLPALSAAACLVTATWLFDYIKRHIAVDTQGWSPALAVTTADVADRKGCLLTLARERDNPGAVQKALADGSYTGKAFASSVQALIGAKVEIAK